MNRRREKEPALPILRTQHDECKKQATCIVIRCRRGTSEVKLPLQDVLCIDCDDCDYFPKNVENQKRPDFAIAYTPGDPPNIMWVIVEMKGRVKSSQDTIDQILSGAEVIRDNFPVRGYGQTFAGLVVKSGRSRLADVFEINAKRVPFNGGGIRMKVVQSGDELTKVLAAMFRG